MTAIIPIAQMIRELNRQFKTNREAIGQLQKDNANIKRVLVRLKTVANADGKARIGLGKKGWYDGAFEISTAKKKRKKRRKNKKQKVADEAS